MLNSVDGRIRVWRQRNTSFQQEHIVSKTAFGGGGFTVWGCLSLSCKLDLCALNVTLTGQMYRDQTLRPLVVPYVDCHPLSSRQIIINNNARPHRARRVEDYLQQEATEYCLPWPAMSLDMNPIEHVWHYLRRNVNARTPKSQNIQELGTAWLRNGNSTLNAESEA